MSLLVQVGQVSAADVTTKARDIDPLIASECVLVLFDFDNFIMFNGCWDVVGIWQDFTFNYFTHLMLNYCTLDLMSATALAHFF